jgi:hypothetical protein
MRDRIEAARAEMSALASPEWVARIKLHAMLLPGGRFMVDRENSRIIIKDIGPVQPGSSSLG